MTANDRYGMILTPERCKTHAPRRVFGDQGEQVVSKFFRRGNIKCPSRTRPPPGDEQVATAARKHMGAKRHSEKLGGARKASDVVSAPISGQYLIFYTTPRAARMGPAARSATYCNHVETSRNNSDGRRVPFRENPLRGKIRSGDLDSEGSSVATRSNMRSRKAYTQVISVDPLQRVGKSYPIFPRSHRFLRESPEVDVHTYQETNG